MKLVTILFLIVAVAIRASHEAASASVLTDRELAKKEKVCKKPGQKCKVRLRPTAIGMPCCGDLSN